MYKIIGRAALVLLSVFSVSGFCEETADGSRDQASVQPNLKLAKEYYLEGKAHYEKGEFELAVEAFRKSLYEDPDNLMLNHLIGQAAYETGDYEEALFAYERALVLDPKYSLSRLEKARTHLALGAKAAAKKELEQVLEQDIPPEVRNNVTKLLAGIGTDRRHRFSGVISITHTHDSNTTLGTTDSIPSPFDPSLKSDPSALSDRIGAIATVINHRYPLPIENLTWKNGLVFYLSDNDNVSSNDLWLWTLNTGINFQKNRWLFDTYVSWSNIYVAQRLFQNNLRFVFKYIFQQSKKFQLSSGIHYTKRHHFHPVGGPAITNTFGMVLDSTSGFTYVCDPENSFSGEFMVRYDKTPVDGMPPTAYTRYKLSGRFTHIFSGKVTANAATSYYWDRYRNPHAIYTTKHRQDGNFAVSCGVNVKVHEHVLVGVTAEHSSNDSNIPLNRYDSNKLTTSVTGVF